VVGKREEVTKKMTHGRLFYGEFLSAVKTAVEFAAPKNYCPAMRAFLMMILLLGSLGSVFAVEPVTGTNDVKAVATAKTGRVLKVLPFLLDQHGQDSTSPSLFDRDAYQAQLRARIKLTNEVSGIRFDVQWKAARTTKLKIRIEARGVVADGTPKIKTFEADGTAGFFSQWTKFTLTGEDYKNFGSLVAWHATLWNGDQLLNEQKSFLW
jgi:hypothetical protein